MLTAPVKVWNGLRLLWDVVIHRHAEVEEAVRRKPGV